MADYDPPHTKLRSRSQQAASTDDVFGSKKETEIFKFYEIGGQPSRTIASVEKAARPAGWGFVEASCSVADKRLELTFKKRLKEFTAIMSTGVELPRGLYRDEYRKTWITLESNHYNLDLAPKPQTRKDISCLDDLT